MILPFFQRFIRERGFERWYLDKVGTEEDRVGHPFPWTYDEATGTVHFEDRFYEDGDIREVKETYSITDALRSLLSREVALALSSVRGMVADKPSDAETLVRVHELELQALREELQRYPELSHYLEIHEALDTLAAGLTSIAGVKSGGDTHKSAPVVKPVDGRMKHGHRKSWIVDTYRRLLDEDYSLKKGELVAKVQEEYTAIFGEEAPEGRTIRRYLAEDSNNS